MREKSISNRGMLGRVIYEQKGYGDFGDRQCIVEKGWVLEYCMVMVQPSISF